ncbi:hypothetical protein [Desulfosediminicola flagellatus]|nr:hypothetical protein [Desulfosediminicola flagellatus]
MMNAPKFLFSILILGFCFMSALPSLAADKPSVVVMMVDNLD